MENRSFSGPLTEEASLKKVYLAYALLVVIVVMLLIAELMPSGAAHY